MVDSGGVSHKLAGKSASFSHYVESPVLEPISSGTLLCSHLGFPMDCQETQDITAGAAEDRLGQPPVQQLESRIRIA